MAKRAMMFCPTCDMMAQTFNNPALRDTELFTEMPENDVFRCTNGHAEPNYIALMAKNPRLIKLVPQEKPQPTDVRVDVWIDKDIWEKFHAIYPHQTNSTIQSIMSLHLTGQPVIIDGPQAKKLNAMGVRNGAEMVAALEVAKSLEGQLDTANEKIAMFQSMFAGAGIASPV
jgi:hypothetical protein